MMQKVFKKIKKHYPVAQKMANLFDLDNLSLEENEKCKKIITDFVSLGIIEFYLQKLPDNLQDKFKKEIESFDSVNDFFKIIQKYMFVIPDVRHRLDRYLYVKYVEFVKSAEYREVNN